MQKRGAPRPVATLWRLAWKNDRLLCAVYRSGKSGKTATDFELRLQSGAKTLFTEPFELGPRMISRTDALRRSLLRRGWRDDAR